nr:MAG TPA: hypothetical protein [Herelleviridae sp.]
MLLINEPYSVRLNAASTFWRLALFIHTSFLPLSTYAPTSSGISDFTFSYMSSGITK